MKQSILRSKLLLACAVGASAFSHAQLSVTSSNVGSNAEAGYQNSSSFASLANDPKANLLVQNSSQHSHVDYSGVIGGLSYHDIGDGQLTTLLSTGGIRSDFDTLATAQDVSGANTFAGAAAHGSVGIDVFFTATQNVTAPFHLDGQVVGLPPTGFGGITYQGSLLDHTTSGNNVFLYGAVASSTIINQDTTVTLRAGDHYELAFYELVYSIESGLAVPLAETTHTTGTFSLGSPTPEPCGMVALIGGIGGLIARKRASR